MNTLQQAYQDLINHLEYKMPSKLPSDEAAAEYDRLKIKIEKLEAKKPKSAEKILDKHYKHSMHWKIVNRENVLAAMEEYKNQ